MSRPPASLDTHPPPPNPQDASVPALLLAEMEVEPARKGEEREEEGAAPAVVKEEGPPLEKGEAPEESEESASTDSGQELGAEARGLRSGTYGDRMESKAYGSVIHKCEVRRGRWRPCLGPAHDSAPDSAPCPHRTVGRSSRTLGISSGTSASTRARSRSRAGSAAKPSLTRPPARPTRRHTGRPRGRPLPSPDPPWIPAERPPRPSSSALCRQPAEALWLRGVRQELPAHQLAEPAQEAALGRGALPLRGLWQALHHVGQSQAAPAGA